MFLTVKLGGLVVDGLLSCENVDVGQVTCRWETVFEEMSDQIVQYRIDYQPTNELTEVDSFRLFDPSVTTFMNDNLAPDVEYEIFVTAITNTGVALSNILTITTEPDDTILSRSSNSDKVSSAGIAGIILALLVVLILIVLVVAFYRRKESKLGTYTAEIPDVPTQNFWIPEEESVELRPTHLEKIIRPVVKRTVLQASRPVDEMMMFDESDAEDVRSYTLSQLQPVCKVTSV